MYSYRSEHKAYKQENTHTHKTIESGFITCEVPNLEFYEPSGQRNNESFKRSERKEIPVGSTNPGP